MLKPRSNRRPGWLIVVLVCNAALAGALSVEVLARGFIYAFDNWRIDYRVYADGHRGDDWARDYYNESRRSAEVAWRSYVYWRRLPFAGRFINVDINGIRRTWTPAEVPATSPRVFVMGGSTVWGTGSRDEHTLPSALARELDRAGQAAVVVNYGESGYVSGQSLIALIGALREGTRPALVIFYGGVEDTFAAYQNGVAGIPQNEANRRTEFNVSNSLAIRSLWKLLTAGTTRTSSLIWQRSENGDALSTSRDESQLAHDVLADYCANVEAASALGRQYGFAVLAFWQPVIFSKVHLTAYERGEAARQQGSRAFFERVYRHVSSSSAACRPIALHDISRLFEQQAAPRFLDSMHVTEEANREIAAAIAPAALQALRHE